MKKIVFGTLVLMFVCCEQVSVAQQVTLGNNLLYDATLTPNLRVGVRLAPHWSVGLTGGYRPWPTDDNTQRKWRHVLGAADLRFWVDSVDVHHFLGMNLIYSHYNVADVRFPFGLWKSVRDERRQGDLGAVGLFYGYSWPLGRRWNIEALLGAAVGYTKYDRYACGHCGQKLGDGSKVFVMPQAAVSVVYNIPGRPRPVVKEEEVIEIQTVMPDTLPTAKVEEKPYVPVVTPVPDFTGRAGQLQQENPVLQHISQYTPYDRTRILRKEKGALYVHFPVGKSVLNTAFRQNAETLDRIVDITRQIIADTTSSVQKIQIVGLASIEGGIAGNERLALNRAKSLQRYVQQQVQVADSVFDTVGGGEAWAEFRDQLQDIIDGRAATPALSASQVEGLRQAVAIIDREADANQRERQLQRLNGGRTWAYLKQHVLSDQRNSGYVRIFFDYVPDTAAATINRASQLLASGQHAEALTLLESVRADERAQNALGVALWQNGRRDEALDCFRRAAAQGNADAQENLRQLEQRVK